MRNDLNSQTTSLESIFVEILNEKSKISVVGVIYRPPNNDLQLFLEELECITTVKKTSVMATTLIDLLPS